MSKILIHSVRLRCATHRAFEMFTVNELLRSWLAINADVKPEVGGKYELYWDPTDRERNSTLGCKVIGIEPDKFISFDWKGPKQFQHFMNSADPLTHVTVFFIPCNEKPTSCTDVYLIHTGWRSTADWEAARQWFERAWDSAFETLNKLVDT